METTKGYVGIILGGGGGHIGIMEKKMETPEGHLGGYIGVILG